MEVESSKGHVALPSLPDDIFLHLAKYHLTERDCLALALSGAMNESYASLHGINRFKSFTLKCKLPSLTINTMYLDFVGNAALASASSLV